MNNLDKPLTPISSSVEDSEFSRDKALELIEAGEEDFVFKNIEEF